MGSKDELDIFLVNSELVKNEGGGGSGFEIPPNEPSEPKTRSKSDWPLPAPPQLNDG